MLPVATQRDQEGGSAWNMNDLSKCKKGLGVGGAQSMSAWSPASSVVVLPFYAMILIDDGHVHDVTLTNTSGDKKKRKKIS